MRKRVLSIFMIICMVIAQFPDVVLAQEQSTNPTAASTIVEKTTATQASVDFTLTNDPAYTDGQKWKIYQAETGDTIADGVTASNVGNILTLTHETDVPIGDYYIAVTEEDKSESVRLKLTVEAYVPLWTDGLTYNASSIFSGGTGAVDNPYLISSANDLAQLALNVNSGTNYSGKYFKMTANINLSGKYWSPIGYVSTYSRGFQGKFDGNSHVVDNMKICMSKLGSNYFLGLFGWVYNGASVTNLGLTNASMIIDKQGSSDVGLLIGYADAGITIDNCFACGNIEALEDVRYIGGLVGQNYSGGSITNCYFIGDINAVGGTGVGGMIGYRRSAVPTNCYVAASITSTATNRYAIADSATNSYYDSTLNSSIIGGGGLPKTTTELKTEAMATLLNKGGMVWGYDAEKNSGYPYLNRSSLGEDYTYNTPAPVTVNGVTASVTALAPESPQKGTTPLTATVTLTGQMAAAGIHSVSIQSANSGIATEVQKRIFVQPKNLSEAPLTFKFSFTMPAQNIADLTLIHTFESITPTIDGAGIYANGAAIKIIAGTTTDYTNILYDKNGDGTIEDDEFLQIGATSPTAAGYYLAGYSVFGGSKDIEIIGDTNVTMMSGKIGTLYGGSNSAVVNGSTNVKVYGGTVIGYTLGGGNTTGSDVTVGTNLSIFGGTLQNCYGGSGGANMTGNASIIMQGGSVSQLVACGPYNSVGGTGKTASIKVTGGTITTTGDAVNTRSRLLGGTTQKLCIIGGTIRGNINSSIVPVNEAAEPVSVYKSTLTLTDGVTPASAEVTSFTTSDGYTYGVNGMFPDANGKIYVWLPEGTTITAVVAGETTYVGSVTTFADGKAAGLLVKEGLYTVWVNGVQLSDEGQKTVTCGDGTAKLDTSVTPYKLTLTNATITEDALNAGIYSLLDLDLVLSGTNTVNTQAAASVVKAYGVYCGGNLNISGTGSLYSKCNMNIAASNFEGFGIYSGGSLTTTGCSVKGESFNETNIGGNRHYGVRVLGDITINGGTLEGIGGDLLKYGDRISYGIFADGAANVLGGTLKGKCGEAGDNGFGIYINKSVTVTKESDVPGLIEGTGGAAKNYSTGIYLASTLTMTGGSIIGTGGTASVESYGLYQNAGTNQITDSTINGTAAGEVTNNSKAVRLSNTTLTNTVVNGICGSATGTSGESIAVAFGNLTATGGSITGEAGSSGKYSYGIYANTVTLNGDADLNGTADTATTESYGIYAKAAFTTNEDFYGTMIGIGGDSKLTSGARIYGTLTLRGGSLSGTAGNSTADNGYSYGLALREGGSGVALNLYDGSLTGTAGSAEYVNGKSVGINCNNNVNIYGGSVSATGDSIGEVGAQSCGFNVAGNFSMSYGLVTFSGDTCAFNATGTKDLGAELWYKWAANTENTPSTDYTYSATAPYAWDTGDKYISIRLAPAILAGNSVYRQSAEAATIRFYSSTAGTCYYVVSDSETSPTAVAIKTANTGIFGSRTIRRGTNIINITGMESGGRYIHLYVENEGTQQSGLLTLSMPDDVYFYDDFEAYAVDTLCGDSKLSFAMKNNGTVAKITSDTNHVMQLSGNYDYRREPMQYVNMPANSNGRIVLETRIKTVAINGGTGSIYLYDNATNQVVASVSAGSDSKWHASAYGQTNTLLGATTDGITYTVGNWYTIRLEYNTSINTYDVFIDNEKVNTTPLIGGGSREAYSFVLRAYDSGWSADCAFCFDDAKMSLKDTYPTIMGSSINRQNATEATVNFLSNTSGTAYYQITDSATPPADVITGGTDGGAVTGSATNKITLSGLTGGAKYLHMVVKNADHQLSNVISIYMPYDMYFYDDFEAYAVNTQCGDEKLSFAMKNNGTIARISDDNGRVLHLCGNYDSRREPMQYVELPANSDGRIVLETRIKAVAINGGTGSLYLYDNATNQVVASISAGSDSKWHASAYGQANTLLGATADGIAYTTGNWYTIRLEYRTDTNTYDVFVDNEKVNATPLAGGGVRTAYSFSLRAYDSGWTADCCFYYDDAKMYLTDTYPTLTGCSINRQSATEATVSFLSNTSGTAYYQITDSATPPTDVITGGTDGGTITGSVTNTITIAGLTSGAKYVHLVVKNATNQVSAVKTFSMPYDVCFIDDFEAYATGTHPLPFTSRASAWSAPGKLYANLSGQGTVNNDLRLSAAWGDQSYRASEHVSLPNDLNGILVFSAQVTPISATGGLMMIGNKSGYSQYAACIDMSGNTFKASGASTHTSTTARIFGNTYQLMLVLNTKTNTFDYYVDNIKQNDVPLAAHPTNTPQNIGFVSMADDSGNEFRVDNVEAYVAPSYTCNTPEATIQNGVTPVITISPVGPQAANTTITVNVALSGTAVQAGTHKFSLSSMADVSTINAPSMVTKDVSVGQVMTASDTLSFTFSMPAQDVDDLVLTHTFTKAPDKYLISYDSNGGSGDMTEGTATEGVPYTLPSNGFTAPNGYRFKTWAIGSATSNDTVDAGSTYTFTGPTTVYAIWELIPTYTIEASITEEDYGTKNAGYIQPAAQTVTITNTGNQTVTISKVDPADYEVSELSVTSLAPQGTATFTVQPKGGLLAGTYNEQIVVSTENETSATVEVRFKVNQAFGVAIDPQSATIISGNSQLLTANPVGGSGSYTYKWYRGSETTQFATTKAVTVTPSTTTTYKVIVNDTIEEKTISATITVNPRTYVITVQSDGNGFAKANKKTATAGSAITLTATPKSNYKFKAWLVVKGKATMKGNILTLTAGDVTVKAVFEKITPPITVGVPTSVKAASAAYNKIKISWKKVNGATGYQIYQYNSKTKKYSIVKTTTATSYSWGSLNTGTTYKFIVRANKKVSGKTIYSSYSKVVSAKPVLSKVISLKAKNSKSKTAVLSWKKVSGASGYVIYRSTKKSSGYKTVTTIKKSSTVTYTNKKLSKGKTYYYKVRAYRTVSGKKVYASYSSVVKIKINK